MVFTELLSVWLRVANILLLFPFVLASFRFEN